MASQAASSALTGLDVIYMRRSIRRYTADYLDDSTLETLVEAAVQAPTAVREEPWAFVIVRDRATLVRYSDRAKQHILEQLAGAPEPTDEARHQFLDQMRDPEFCIFYNAPALVVICTKPVGPFAEADCWLAAGTFMLAATALGLGTCCIGSAVPILNAPDVKAELAIAPDMTAVAPIIVGVPAGAVAPVSRKPPEILSWR
ncbi:MAG: nitroreductase family protein [Betaproteobacteria bacterium]